MTDKQTKQPPTQFEHIQDTAVSRDTIKHMLERYHDDLRSIDLMLEALDEDMFLYPSGTGTDSERVQSSVQPGDLIDALISRANTGRRYYLATLRELKSKRHALDRLMLCVSRLPGHERLVVLENMVNGRALPDISADCDKSIAALKEHKQSALDRLEITYNRK